jgi:DNA-binding transcriptional MerR regulator
VTPKLFKAAEVCELTGLQPYVLRSWEKEFPGIGVQKSADSPRLYRQSDVEQVQRIKQLVFSEGLTLAGARRRIEDERPGGALEVASDADVKELLGANARARIANVRDGLRSILSMLSGNGDAPRLTLNGDAHREHVARTARPQPERAASSKRAPARRTKPSRRAPAKKRTARRVR